MRGGGLRRKLGFPMIETPTLMLWGEKDIALSIKAHWAENMFQI